MLSFETRSKRMFPGEKTQCNGVFFKLKGNEKVKFMSVILKNVNEKLEAKVW